MKKYTSDDYKFQLTGKNIQPIEDYLGVHTKIKHKCLVCNHEWNVTPAAIRRGNGCPACYQMSVRKPLPMVIDQCNSIGWSLVNIESYKNSYGLLLFKHTCGEIVESNLDRILRKCKRCTQCRPIKTRKTWAVPVKISGRSYSSKLEMTCCEYLIDLFGANDIVLQKLYSPRRKQTADAYIKSSDTYVEISSINKQFYLDRIFQKRQLVTNFVFVSSFDQLKLFFK